ncbi:MAG TPA: FKBP-type peptidyl-prolyl cis-trans isomerase [Burkholderiales bacterium]|nr:FKBP-type peptidyl-prolyl cis-trans isomerase [Burkholderiales bacterium]
MSEDTAIIGKGSRVRLHYTLSLADGHIVETTRTTSPATHAMGSGEWLMVLEERLLGMRAGQSRRFEIAAAEIVMPPAPEPQVMSRDEFPPELKLESGQVIGFSLPSGEEIPGTILEVSEYEVTVDFTHPLAGRDLVWEVEILDVIPTKTG